MIPTKLFLDIPLLTLQGLLPVIGAHQDEADDPAPGPDLLSLLHALSRRCDLHASPGRALYYLLCPRAYGHLGGYLPQGSVAKNITFKTFKTTL